VGSGRRQIAFPAALEESVDCLLDLVRGKPLGEQVAFQLHSFKNLFARKFRLVLTSIAVILFVPALRNFYALEVPDADIVAEMILIGVLSVVAIEMVWRVTQRMIARRSPEYAAASAGR